ncbi:hypothetical protein ACJX0J_032989, partial [Zea mays]
MPFLLSHMRGRYNHSGHIGLFYAGRCNHAFLALQMDLTIKLFIAQNQSKGDIKIICAKLNTSDAAYLWCAVNHNKITFLYGYCYKMHKTIFMLFFSKKEPCIKILTFISERTKQIVGCYKKTLAHKKIFKGSYNGGK